MNFLALHDDVKFIIADHLQSDRKIKKNFMTEHTYACMYVCICIHRRECKHDQCAGGAWVGCGVGEHVHG